VEQYAAEEDNKLEFQGTIIKVDQARSTASARGKQQEELDATVRVMHLYFRIAMGVFRCMRDNLIGDEVNGVVKAPEDNPQVSSVEAARLLHTVRALFEIHNELVSLEEKTAGKSVYSRLKIRGSLATGKVAIMRNDIRHTMICDLMNFAARMAGIPSEMELIVNGEAAKHLEPYFALEKVNITGIVEDKVGEYEKELDAMGDVNGKELETEEGREGLLRRIELNYRLFKLYEILYSVFELPNREEGVKDAKETPFLEKMSSHRDRYHDLMDEYDLHGEKEMRGRIKAMMREVDDEYYAETFNKVRRLHLKGFGIEAFKDLYKLVGYKTFAKDCKSVPANCRFRDIFLGEEGISSDGRTGIERFIDAVADAHYVAPRADFNPGVILYLMTTMQLTGSPDFAYQKTCRAVGMALYAVDEIRKNWDNQPNLFLQKAQEDLVKRGVFSPTGELNGERLSDYLAESVVLPAMLNEVGLLTLGSAGNGNGGAAQRKITVGDLGQWLAKDRATFTLAEAPIKEAVMNLHRESAAYLRGINAKTEKEYGYMLFSDRMIGIIEGLSYQQDWKGIAEKLEPADALAAEIILTSGAVQSMRKLKAYKLNRGQKPIDWKTIKFELGKLKLHPYMLGLYSELFLE
jgi:hypothetical protein